MKTYMVEYLCIDFSIDLLIFFLHYMITHLDYRALIVVIAKEEEKKQQHAESFPSISSRINKTTYSKLSTDFCRFNFFRLFKFIN